MNNDVKEIEVSIEQAQAAVKRGEQLTRLHSNPDFIALIREDYFKAEPARLVSLKASPNMQSPDRQELIMKDIDAIGGLQQHFNSIWAMATQAADSIEQAEEELASIRLEEDAE